MVKKNYVKNGKNENIVSQFWYTLNNLEPKSLLKCFLYFLKFDGSSKMKV